MCFESCVGLWVLGPQVERAANPKGSRCPNLFAAFLTFLHRCSVRRALGAGAAKEGSETVDPVDMSQGDPRAPEGCVSG